MVLDLAAGLSKRFLFVCGVVFVVMSSCVSFADDGVFDNIDAVPGSVSLDANARFYSDGAFDYASSVSVGMTWYPGYMRALDEVSFGFSLGDDGFFTLSVDLGMHTPYGGYLRVGNQDWVSGTLGVSPASLSAGYVFSSSAWKGGLDNGVSDLGRIDDASPSFVSGAFYSSPRASYYARFGDVKLGVSLGYGGEPSRAFTITEEGIVGGDVSDLGASYGLLGGVGALYSDDIIDISLVADAAVGDNNVVSSGASAGLKVRHTPAEFAVSIGYLSNDPRITTPVPFSETHNKGAYATIGVAYPVDDVFKLSFNGFAGRSQGASDDEMHKVYVGMVGVEYIRLINKLSIIPFVEAGVYRSDRILMGGADTTVKYDGLLFFGMKADLSL